MAWPSEAGSIAGVNPARGRQTSPAGGPRSCMENVVGLQRYYVDLRGLYRVFNVAEYRFYRSNTGPPAESDTPFATNATLPHQPTDLYANGVWYLSVSYFNGVIDSGFLPIGSAGETYLRLDLDLGAQINNPPRAPAEWTLEKQEDGIVQVSAWYLETGSLRATEWALTYASDGSTPGTPPAVNPTETVGMPIGGVVVLEHDLPNVEPLTYKVRLQTRRLDGANWRYSENSIVLTKGGAPGFPEGVAAASSSA